MRPMVGEPVFSAAMVTIGVFIVLQVIAGDLIGLEQRQVGDPWGLDRTEVAGVIVFHTDLAKLAVTATVVALLWLFFKYSRWGLAMRATAFSQETALAQGVPVGRMFALSWAIAGALAAIAGMLVGTGGAGFDQTTTLVALKALPAIILGGLDSIRGAIVGGLLIGLAEAYTKTYQAEHVAWARRQLRPGRAVPRDADRAAGPALRAVRHPGGGARMRGRPELFTSYAARPGAAQHPGQAGLVRAAAGRPAGLPASARRRAERADGDRLPRGDRGDRAQHRHRLGGPGVARARLLPRHRRLHRRRARGRPGRPLARARARHGDLAAGRRARRRPSSGCRSRRWPPGCEGLYLAIVTLGLVFLGEHLFRELDRRHRRRRASGGRPPELRLFGVDLGTAQRDPRRLPRSTAR